MTLPATAAGLVARLHAATFDVPVDPDAPTARRWASDELARAEYHQGRSLLRRLLDWIAELFDGLPSAGLMPWQAALVVVAVLVVVALVALWVTGPVRAGRARSRKGPGVLAHDDTRTAAELRAAADDAAARGDFARAVVERFRAIVRSLEERTVLDVRPGRTAHEATEEAGRRLPDAHAELVRAGRLFDDVAYGEGTAGVDDDAWLRALDARVLALRPAALGGSGSAGSDRALVVSGDPTGGAR